MPNRSRAAVALAVSVVALTLAPPAQAQFGGGGSQERAIVAQFDVDKDGRLNADERTAARAFMGPSLDGRGFGRGGNRPPPPAGVRVAPADVTSYPRTPLYDESTLRTLFLELDNPEWEAELVAFNNTDVDVPATVTVDGKVYRDVGVHFRGNSSFGVGNGYKRSFNLKFDFVDEDQSIGGYRTLNLLNANADPSMMRTVLSLHIARQYIPAPRANFVRVVINGENWGVYASAQQFDKTFLEEHFKTTKGTRWKVPQGGGSSLGGFTYAGDDPGSYRLSFQIKSKEEPAAWQALVGLATVLRDTPPAQLEAALAPRLDIDEYLRFLAVDNVMAGGDGFYQRAADYSLYLDPDGRFHFTFHDSNEMFSWGGGRRGPGSGGVFLNPLFAQDDASKPIISKILAAPALRAKYLGYVRDIADRWLNWETVGPLVRQYRDLIDEEVTRDTRKLYSTEDFLRETSDDAATGTLRNFFAQRRAFLLDWTAR